MMCFIVKQLFHLHYKDDLSDFRSVLKEVLWQKHDPEGTEIFENDYADVACCSIIDVCNSLWGEMLKEEQKETTSYENVTVWHDKNFSLHTCGTQTMNVWAEMLKSITGEIIVNRFSSVLISAIST